MTISEHYAAAQIAWQSTQVLLQALWQAVVYGKSDVTWDGPCPIAPHGQTQFFLATSNTYCQTVDYFVLFYLVLAVHTVSWGLRWCVWEPAVRRLFRHLSKHDTRLPRLTQRKISMHSTAAFFFTLSALTAGRLFAGEPWLYQPATWLHDRKAALEDPSSDRTVPAAVKAYYLLYAARFLSDTASLPAEVGRTTTTFCVAVLHHCVTLGLIAIAVYGHYIRGAAVIMFFFDWADPPLLGAKICKYLSEAMPNHHTALPWLANRLFEVFAVIFLTSRNGLYNFVTYSFCTTLPPEAVVERLVLLLLVALQTYWAILIVQAAVRREASTDGTIQDVREKTKEE